MSQDDRELLARMRRGDEAAARVLWERHSPRLTAYAQAILSRADPGGAADVVQTVFLAALRARLCEGATARRCEGATARRLRRSGAGSGDALLRGEDAASSGTRAGRAQPPRASVAEVSDVAGWLLRLTRNAALDRVRTLRREGARLAAVRARAGAQGAADHDALHAALAELPRQLREVVALKHAGGLTFDQMAAALGANRSTVAGRYRSAIEALRRRLVDEPEPVREVLHARP